MIIAIEGMDGSGKTTQAKLISKKLKKIGYEVEYVRTTYFLSDEISDFLGKNIKDKLPSPRKRKVKKENSSKQNKKVENIIIKKLGFFYALFTILLIQIKYPEKIVICDRFFYQFFYDLYGDKTSKVLDLFPEPDKAFILTVDIKEARARMTDEFDKNTDGKYFEDLKKFFKYLSKEHNFNIIDSNDSIREVHKKIFNHLTKKILTEA